MSKILFYYFIHDKKGIQKKVSIVKKDSKKSISPQGTLWVAHKYFSLQGKKTGLAAKVRDIFSHALNSYCSRFFLTK